MEEKTEEEITIKDVILKIIEWKNYLLTKWLVILVVGLLGGIIGFIYANMHKPVYTATLSFALEDEKASGGSGGGIGGFASQFGFDLGSSGGGIFSGANLMELMRSRTLVEKTLLNPVKIGGKEMSLAEYYIQFNGLRDEWKKEGSENQNIQFLPNENLEEYSLEKNKIMGSISGAIISGGMLTVGQKDKKVSITYVEVVCEDELFSKLFTEELVKQVSEFYIDTKSKKAKINLAILEKQSDSIRAELNAGISGVASANDNTFNLNPALNIKRVTSSRKQIDVQANTAILTQLVQNVEIAKVSLRKETPLIQVIDKPILPLPKTKVSRLKSIATGGLVAGLLIMICLVGVRLWKGLFSIESS